MYIIQIGKGVRRLFNRDAKLFFGYDKNDKILNFKTPIKLNALFRDLGIYESSSDAYRAGYAGDIPKGYSYYLVKNRPMKGLWREVGILYIE